MRILLPIIQFPPDVNPTGVLMAQLCEGLTACGHEVSVITTFPHYENFRIWEEYKGKLVKRDRERGMEIVRLFTYAPGNKSMLNRLISYVTFNGLAAITAGFSRARWDIIVCTNGSFFTGLTGWLLGKAKNVPFIYKCRIYTRTFPSGQVSCAIRLPSRHSEASKDSCIARRPILPL